MVDEVHANSFEGDLDQWKWVLWRFWHGQGTHQLTFVTFYTPRVKIALKTLPIEMGHEMV